MLVDLAHERWKRKLLDSRKDGQLYQMIGIREDESPVDILFKYKDGQWQFRTNFISEPVKFSDIDEATRFIIANGVERYSEMFGI